PARHQTMRATIAWSHDLLPDGERRLFDRLGVFAAPAPLDGVERVCCSGQGGDVVADLAGLIDKSLVRRVEGPRGDPGFTMLALLREFALEHLDASGEGDEVRRRHARYVLDVVTGYEDARWGEAAGYWIDDVHARGADIRAAHEWAVGAGDRRTAAGIAAALYGYVEVHPQEIGGWIQQAVGWVDDLDPVTAGRLLIGAGYAELLSGRPAAARARLEAALAHFRDIGHDRYTAF